MADFRWLSLSHVLTSSPVSLLESFGILSWYYHGKIVTHFSLHPLLQWHTLRLRFLAPWVWFDAAALMTACFTFSRRLLWSWTLPISTVTWWVTQQDTCLLNIMKTALLPLLTWRTCPWLCPQVLPGMWVRPSPSYLCLLASFPVLFFSCFVPGVWFDYRFLQTASLGLVLHYNCGLNEVSVNAFWWLKLPWSPLLVQLCHPLSWQFVWTVILLSWHVVRWNIWSVLHCDGAGGKPPGFTTKSIKWC